ncbi:MAG: hypothetical protein GMKNLPBB_01951 [Myxococcota bacterium]|nr:hypothetical protein [Myxococcota bacterium]
MPNLIAMSFEGELAPSFELRCLKPGRTPPDGWGIGFYPGGEPSASVLKEPAPPHGSIRSQLVDAWEHLASSIFVMHMRRARWGSMSDANTQPFCRSWGRRDWLMAHSGSLARKLEIPQDALFEPVGSTDSEAIFCALLNRFHAHGWKRLRDADLLTVHDWLHQLNELGDMSLVMTDGGDVLVYADKHRESQLYTWRVLPPYDSLAVGNNDLMADFSRRGVKSRKGVIVCSEKLKAEQGPESQWKPLAPGRMMLIRQGAIRAEIQAPDGAGRDRVVVNSHAAPRRPSTMRPKTLSVVHRTVYKYEEPVQRSRHKFRLRPLHDPLQNLLQHSLSLSTPGQTTEFQDVFGNHVHRLHVEEPFSEMVIEAKSRVRVLDTDPLNFNPLHVRSTIPLVWMPWQRHMLQPYLLPPELPETELAELTEYAMSFVERNSYDLLDTLLDMNDSIFKEYKYSQGSTNLYTTPFDVYVNRRGVCQDFANLFICLARLLSVPARYVCGYIYVGPRNENQVQSEASHAWVQVYLPEAGWKGFDPTNGCMTQTDHIRVAVGRNYVDATPTSGTIYQGGKGESLSVDVRVEALPEAGET